MKQKKQAKEETKTTQRETLPDSRAILRAAVQRREAAQKRHMEFMRGLKETRRELADAQKALDQLLADLARGQGNLFDGFPLGQALPQPMPMVDEDEIHQQVSDDSEPAATDDAPAISEYERHWNAQIVDLLRDAGVSVGDMPELNQVQIRTVDELWKSVEHNWWMTSLEDTAEHLSNLTGGGMRVEVAREYLKVVAAYLNKHCGVMRIEDLPTWAEEGGSLHREASAGTGIHQPAEVGEGRRGES
jgi:hypothetical protein